MSIQVKQAFPRMKTLTGFLSLLATADASQGFEVSLGRSEGFRPDCDAKIERVGNISRLPIPKLHHKLPKGTDNVDLQTPVLAN